LVGACNDELIVAYPVLGSEPSYETISALFGATPTCDPELNGCASSDTALTEDQVFPPLMNSTSRSAERR